MKTLKRRFLSLVFACLYITLVLLFFYMKALLEVRRNLFHSCRFTDVTFGFVLLNHIQFQEY